MNHFIALQQRNQDIPNFTNFVEGLCDSWARCLTKKDAYSCALRKDHLNCSVCTSDIPSIPQIMQKQLIKYFP